MKARANLCKQVANSEKELHKLQASSNKLLKANYCC
jgi:hypothetical protein